MTSQRWKTAITGFAATAMLCLVWLPKAWSAIAQPKPRYAISVGEITSLLEQAGIGANYKLSVPTVGTAVESPQLQVEAKSLAGNALRLRIGCGIANQCLPFYVVLRFGSAEQAEEIAGLIVAQRRLGSHRRTVIAKRAPLLVHGGSLAKLEVVSGGVRLFLYVRCLQSGAAGETVRARDEETHRNYLAQVVDLGKLRSEL